jgi:hypothetical protein
MRIAPGPIAIVWTGDKKVAISRTAIRHFSLGKAKSLNERDWSSLEQIIGKGLPDDVRNEINSANAAFAAFGGLYIAANSKTVKATKKAIDAWYKARGRLLIGFGRGASVKKINRKEFLQRFSEPKAARLAKLQSISFLSDAVSACMAVSLSVAEELSTASAGSVLGPDLWRAWVMLIALAMTQAGVKISASSSNKGTQSRFVLAIEYLHRFFPTSHQRYNGYESISKEIQHAKRRFSKADKTFLYFVLGAWGSNIGREYGQPETEKLINTLRTLTSHEWSEILDQPFKGKNAGK